MRIPVEYVCRQYLADAPDWRTKGTTPERSAMPDSFQRLFMMSEPKILPLNAQAALGNVREPERS
jgi:hypothetical protein